MPKLVFVYGTLKSGEGNHGLLEWYGARRLPGYHQTIIEWPLVERGLPYLLPFPSLGQKVKGELYEVDSGCLMALDHLEGHPFLYKRQSIMVSSLSNSDIERTALAYFYQSSHKNFLHLDHLSWYTATSQPEPM